MNADIFYIHPNDHHFSVLYKKKKAKLFRRFAPMHSPKHHPGPPGGFTASSRCPPSIVFGFAKN